MLSYSPGRNPTGNAPLFIVAENEYLEPYLCLPNFPIALLDQVRIPDRSGDMVVWILFCRPVVHHD
jgi:hypothetical protein